MGKSFAGRTALVTGGGRGIGRQISETLAGRGARVAVNYRTREREAAQTVARITAAGGQAIPVQADVSQADQVEAMVRQVNRQLGPIDLLVNNAGVFHLLAPGEVPRDIWQQTLDINLTGAYLVTWAVKDAMIQRRFGRIVNLSSIGGLRARPRSIAYAVSKAGLIALTKGCSEAWAPYNIRVNALAPGLIETDMTAVVEPSLTEKLIAETPMGRIGRPEEISSVVAFLLSEESSFMTGQTLVVCGGRVLLP